MSALELELARQARADSLTMTLIAVSSFALGAGLASLIGALT